MKEYVKDLREQTSLLTREEEVKLFQKLETAKGEERKSVKNKIVESNLRLVFSIAKRYANKGMEFEDLVAEGNIGLFNAVDKFKLSKGHRFSTYASWWIRQAISRSLADKSRTIRIPVHMVEKMNKTSKVFNNLSQSLEREPSLEEVMEEINIPEDFIMDVLSSAMSFEDFYEGEIDSASLLQKVTEDLNIEEDEDSEVGRIVTEAISLKERGKMPTPELIGKKLNFSLEELKSIMDQKKEMMSLDLNIDGDDGNSTMLQDVIEDKDSNLEDIILKFDLREQLEKSMEILKPRDREIIKMRFGIGYDGPMTLSEISGQHKITKERVRQIVDTCVNDDLFRRTVEKNIKA